MIEDRGDPGTAEQFEKALRGLLTSWREEREISQEWLGVQLGWDQGTVSKVESGRRSISVYEYLAWARALGVGPDEASMSLIQLCSAELDADRSANSGWDTAK